MGDTQVKDKRTAQQKQHKSCTEKVEGDADATESCLQVKSKSVGNSLAVSRRQACNTEGPTHGSSRNVAPLGSPLAEIGSRLLTEIFNYPYHLKYLYEYVLFDVYQKQLNPSNLSTRSCQYLYP